MAVRDNGRVDAESQCRVDDWAGLPGCSFVACAYFSRAPMARVLAALVSGAAAAGFVSRDVLAHQRGWWRYPSVGDRSLRPLVWYASAGIGVFGASLIAWCQRHLASSRTIPWAARSSTMCSRGATQRSRWTLCPAPITLAWAEGDRLVPAATCGRTARQRLPVATRVALPGVGHKSMTLTW